jgi:hypothetical protein
MRRVSMVFLMCVAVLMMASAAFAQEANPCADDAAKFCGKVQQGGGRMFGCLKQNEDQLSPACKQHLVEVKKALDAVHQACKEDITSFCGGGQKGDSGMLKCLKANRSRLSGDCKAKLRDAKEAMK